jgi:hypothetical protein
MLSSGRWPLCQIVDNEVGVQLVTAGTPTKFDVPVEIKRTNPNVTYAIVRLATIRLSLLEIELDV